MKRNHTHPSKALRLPLLIAALCLCAGSGAQERREPEREFEPTAAQLAEAARLRGALAAAVGENFGVARERLTRRSNWHGGQLYWLAHLRARRPGDYYVRYKYRYKDHVNPHDPLYTFVEHKSAVRVGERGCPRRPRHNFICVGDTIILPVLVNDHAGHTFSVEVRPHAPADAASERARREVEDGGLHREPGGAGAGRGAVPNPAGEFLKYLGGRAHYSPHRARGFSVSFEATFEAVRPGSFNLLVTSHQTPPASPAAAGSVPIVILDPRAPVTVLSAKDEVHGYSERFSSTGGGTSFLTTPVILQPGERLTLRYGGYSRRGLSAGVESRRAVEASVKENPPAITLLPFRVDPAQDFNEWVAEFLPPARRE